MKKIGTVDNELEVFWDEDSLSLVDAKGSLYDNVFCYTLAETLSVARDIFEDRFIEQTEG